MATVAWGMMENMGWKEGQGLGKEGQGLRVALRPSKKMDNAGLGKTGNNNKWIEACCAYDSILAKLNQKYGDNVLDEDGSDKSETEQSPKPTETKEERRKRKEEKRQRKAEKKRKRAEEAGQAEENNEDGVTEQDSKKKEKQEKKVKSKDSEEVEVVGSDKDEEDSKKRKRERKEAKRQAKKEKKEKEKKEKEQINATSESSESEDDKPIPVARHIIYAKRHKAKQVAGYSSENKAEIFALELRAHKTAQLKTLVPYGAHYNIAAANNSANGSGKAAVSVVDETSSDEVEEKEKEVKGQVGTYVDDEDDEGEYEEEEENGAKKPRITYENGFTEDTQVDIYNEASEKQIKGRLGLGTHNKKLSKAQRRDRAQRESNLLRIGTYLSKKFVYAGLLGEIVAKKF